VPVIVCIVCPLLRHSQKCGAEDDYETKTSDLSELKIKIRRILRGGVETVSNTVSLQPMS
jgi:hypothetical protein